MTGVQTCALPICVLNGVPIAAPKTINDIIRNVRSFPIQTDVPYIAYLDLHPTRNLYLISSSLASYDTISNFGNDTIVKKIPVNANYNEMVVHSSGSGFDYLSVSRRTLRYIDFRLVGTYFNTIDLRGNHFSFSIIFCRKD